MTKVIVEDGIDLWSDRSYKFTAQGAKNNYLLGSIVMVGGLGPSRPYKGKRAPYFLCKKFRMVLDHNVVYTKGEYQLYILHI